jgi:hypothetical protein
MCQINLNMEKLLKENHIMSAEEENVYASVVYIPKTIGADLRKSHLFHLIGVQR